MLPWVLPQAPMLTVPMLLWLPLRALPPVPMLL
jgi:hypothetical protein